MFLALLLYDATIPRRGWCIFMPVVGLIDPGLQYCVKFHIKVHMYVTTSIQFGPLHFHKQVWANKTHCLHKLGRHWYTDCLFTRTSLGEYVGLFSHTWANTCQLIETNTWCQWWRLFIRACANTLPYLHVYLWANRHNLVWGKRSEHRQSGLHWNEISSATSSLRSESSDGFMLPIASKWPNDRLHIWTDINW